MAIRRFIAMHETESGFSSPQAVREWVGENCEDPLKWRVVEVHVSPVTEQIAEDDRAFAAKQAYRRGVREERQRIIKLLGLD